MEKTKVITNKEIIMIHKQAAAAVAALNDDEISCIDRERLDMGDGSHCLLGQSYGRYSLAPRRLLDTGLFELPNLYKGADTINGILNAEFTHAVRAALAARLADRK